MINSYLYNGPEYGQLCTDTDLSRFGYSEEVISKFMNVIRYACAEFIGLDEVDKVIEYAPEDFMYVMAIALDEAKQRGLNLS